MHRKIDINELALSIKESISANVQFKRLPAPKVSGKSDDALEVLNFGKLILTVYDNGDIEMTGPIYYSIIERYDYRTIEEARLITIERLHYVDDNFDRLVLNPELRPAPLVDRLIAFIRSKLG